MNAQRVMGEVIETRWTCVAASTVDDEGVETPAPDEIGRVTIERRCYFAFRHEAFSWLAEQERQGFVPQGAPSSAATFYHGPTDAPGNCWVATVAKAEDE